MITLMILTRSLVPWFTNPILPIRILLCKGVIYNQAFFLLVGLPLFRTKPLPPTQDPALILHQSEILFFRPRIQNPLICPLLLFENSRVLFLFKLLLVVFI